MNNLSCDKVKDAHTGHTHWIKTIACVVLVLRLLSVN